jgi:hypothetical protein
VGTDQVTLTDEFGIYRLPRAQRPCCAGVFFTDLDVQEIPLELPAGGTIERSVELTSAARYGRAAV